MSEKFILRACNSFRRHVDIITGKMVAILSKFSVLCQYSIFYCLFF